MNKNIINITLWIAILLCTTICNIFEIFSNSKNTINSTSIDNFLSKTNYKTDINSEYNVPEKSNVFSTNLLDISYSVKEFGAKGNYNGTTGTDDFESITKAINFVKTIPNATLYFPNSNGYCITRTLTIPSGINVQMNSPLIYLGDDNSTCLTIGELSKTNNNIKLDLNVKNHSLSDWSNENCIGVKIVNANQCNISIINSSNFTIGAQFIGSSLGFAYNNITLYSIINNKIGIDLTSEDGGWCNENLFYNGRFSCNTNINRGISRYGVRITSNSNYINNDNVFLKPSFELNQTSASPGEAVAILIEHGQTNKFMNVRSESNSSTIARILNNSVENYIEALYGIGHLIDDKSNNPTTIFYEMRTSIYSQNRRIVYSIPSISQIATPYSVGNYTHLQGLITKEYSEINDYNVFEGIKYNDNYIQFTRSVGIGIYVDTTKVKEFIISGQSELGSTEPSAFVVCYDKNNNIITSPNITTPVYSTCDFQTYFGGCWFLSSSSTEKRYFKVSEKVNKIFVGYQGNFSSKVTLKSFMLETTNINYMPSIILPINKENNRLALHPPTLGSWEKGTIIYNDNTTELGLPSIKYIIYGWLCTSSGSPGTWQELRFLNVNFDSH